MGAIPPEPPAEPPAEMSLEEIGGRVRPTEPWPDPPAREWVEEVDAESAARALQVLASAGISMTEEQVENLRIETATITGTRVDAEQEDMAGIQYRRTTAIRRHRERKLFPTFSAAVQTMTESFRALGAAIARLGSLFSKEESALRQLREQIEELEAHVDAEAVDVDADEEAIDEAEGGMGDEERAIRIRLRKTQEGVIGNLQQALYEYGRCKDGCAVEQQEPCDCGFEEILSLSIEKKTSEHDTQRTTSLNDSETLSQSVIETARRVILAETIERNLPPLELQGIRPDERIDIRSATAQEEQDRHEAEILRMRERGAQPTEQIRIEETARMLGYRRHERTEQLRDSSTLHPYRVNAPDQVHTGPRQIITVSHLGVWSNWCEVYGNCPVNAMNMDLGFEHISHYEDGPLPYDADTRVDFELAIGSPGAESIQLSACVPKGARSYGGNMVIPAGEYFGGERLSIRLRNNFSQSLDFHVVISFFTRRFLQHLSTANMDF